MGLFSERTACIACSQTTSRLENSATDMPRLGSTSSLRMAPGWVVDLLCINIQIFIN